MRLIILIFSALLSSLASANVITLGVGQSVLIGDTQVMCATNPVAICRTRIDNGGDRYDFVGTTVDEALSSCRATAGRDSGFAWQCSRNLACENTTVCRTRIVNGGDVYYFAAGSVDGALNACRATAGRDGGFANQCSQNLSCN